MDLTTKDLRREDRLELAAIEREASPETTRAILVGVAQMLGGRYYYAGKTWGWLRAMNSRA